MYKNRHFLLSNHRNVRIIIGHVKILESFTLRRNVHVSEEWTDVLVSNCYLPDEPW